MKIITLDTRKDSTNHFFVLTLHEAFNTSEVVNMTHNNILHNKFLKVGNVLAYFLKQVVHHQKKEIKHH